MPTVDPTGIFSGPLQFCRELIADSHAFRAACGLQPYDLALHRVFAQVAVAPIVRPFCVITDEERTVRRGGFGTATFLCVFEREVPSTLTGSEEAISNWFLNWLGQVALDIRTNADDGKFNRLFVPDTNDSIVKSRRIQRSDLDIEGVDYIRGEITIRAGL